MLEVTDRIRIPDDEFEFAFARAGGPGGQNVNKVSSKALLRWPAAISPSLPDDVRARLLAQQHQRITQDGDLLITSQRFRDQAKNIDDCLEKLRELILLAATLPKPRKKTKVSRAAKARRVADKRHRSKTKTGRRSGGGEE